MAAELLCRIAMQSLLASLYTAPTLRDRALVYITTRNGYISADISVSLSRAGASFVGIGLAFATGPGVTQSCGRRRINDTRVD
jgi:hypothetical protein